MTHRVLYIPGLGDHYDLPRKLALQMWRLFGVSAKLVPMQWYNGLTYEEKLALIETQLQRVSVEGHTVSIVAESAGAAIALRVFANHPEVHCLVTICGVLDPSIKISPAILTNSPAFKQAVGTIAMSRLDVKDRLDMITIITSSYDPVVDQRKNVINGAEIIRLPSRGHLFVVALCLTIYARKIATLIKS